MKRVFFVLNELLEFDFQEYLAKYLPGVSVTIGVSVPPSPEDYDLIVLWNYRKIIPIKDDAKNIVVFHGADLPHGKGWAPIYYSFSEDQPFYTLSGIFAASKVDTGDLVVKARFKIRPNYTATILRKWDAEISVMLVSEILKRFSDTPIQGVKQVGIGSYRPRRHPKDSEVVLGARLSDLINHFRGCEESHPAFFYYQDVKYFLRIEPADQPAFPDDLEIIFPN